MAAIETPWVDSMSPTTYPHDDGALAVPAAASTAVPPTVAAFSPTTISGSSLTSRQRSTIIVHRKSPLLVATPPPVTRALAYSHPFLLPLNRLVGLLSWTSGDPWESFLLVAGFWATVLYGDIILLWAGPILVVLGLILAMYSRRYSPLSSTGLTGEKHGGHGEGDGASKHHKSLDEIVETLRTFTTRCNILLEPLLELTDFLSTQRTATSATTRPALISLTMRIVLVTPIWILLTLPPFCLITPRRVILSVGTVIITWHSKPARISRVILWRSLTVRRLCSIITGLQFYSNPYPSDKGSNAASKSSLLSLNPFRRKSDKNNSAANISMKKRRADSSGVRFTFILYENQRRWLGIGWTYSLFAYERAAWTDEHLNPVPQKDEFELPEVESGNARWRWVPGSEWRIDNNPSDVPNKKSSKSAQGTGGNGAGDDEGWIYYDNKWNDGRRGQDGWGRYTRRRKWCRDAELVEISPSSEITPPPSPTLEKGPSPSPSQQNRPKDDDITSETGIKNCPPCDSGKARKRRWFGSSELSRALASSPGSASGLQNSESSSAIPATATGTGASTNASAGTPTTNLASSSCGNIPNVRATSTSNSYSNSHSHYANSFDNAGGTGSSSSRNSLTSRRRGRPGPSSLIGVDTDGESLSRSIRDQEIEEAENVVDRFGNRPGGAAERAERGWGLGDDAHMGLS
ncbi:integral peroxisomal membrane protein [Blastomyces dermatitidis ATCC 18188]|uniref:Integral peroxisomal membrane protein n=2 Tax=Ajellomyces dermatitidis (strain ATCC 18188 / CBS 674.68) TaxID=653446 RepID=F2T5T1_AJEDA|nr:integral peroxisomal membrane protein [Blastomyces dermatitidis ATCC 18188]